ncbi:uncharacterized protein zgc:113184 [Notolabrus celidotus]|uniref:uncharacterized protein zgc:113184 n=1 Tax=Notolabrus celidotus TaxID=1203425 RepID=UPI0014905024|nr:uncharacterized protein zgc:113184 [Notolabrus celidotus]XP_034550403.1 uncharacterized protein zgc:113184 [Notolabrus celidotus]XP_034550411.1 uncharacterized protein zgc:113184 [Notolabrus celidotus]
MEEAYSELYQQFIRLRSLCMKQAALLHHLTAALQKQQGAPVPNRESDTMPFPVQSTQEIPVCLHEKPQQFTTTAYHPAAQCGVDGPHGNVGTFSNLLAEDMSKLCVGSPPQRKEDWTLEQQKVAPLLSVDSGWQGASFNVSKNLGQADHLGGDNMVLTEMMPVSAGPALVEDCLCPSSGMLMSDVTLQSHVCEFCQAVFPGDTTTRGEFLRHLYTHVS